MPWEEVLQDIQEEIKQDLLTHFEGRTTKTGELHVSHLIYCPFKYYYELKYPEIVNEPNLAVLEGIRWEDYITKILAKIFRRHGGSEITTELNSRFKWGGREYTLIGRPDFMAELNGTIYVIEIKKPKNLIVSPSAEIKEFHLNAGEVFIPENYILQAQIYDYMARLEFGDKVKTAILALTQLRHRGKTRMNVSVTPIQPITREEIKEIVRRFFEEPAPRYSWECFFCPFNAVCDYKNTNQNPNPPGAAVDELLRIYKENTAILLEARERDSLIKKKIRELVQDEYNNEEYRVFYEEKNGKKFLKIARRKTNEVSGLKKEAGGQDM